MLVRITSSFVAKAVAAVGLVVLGDRLFWVGGGFGSNLGLFALAWAVVTLLLTRAAWRNRRSRVAAGAALLLDAILADDPGLIAFALFWSALAMAVLLPRLARFDHAGRWVLRLLIHGVTGIAGPWRDLFRARRRIGVGTWRRSVLPLLPLPLIGGAVFLALFAGANPLIGNALQRIGRPEIDFLLIVRLVFWAFLATMVWAAFRPRRQQMSSVPERSASILELPGVSVGSVTLALVTFNLLFGLQNGLDLAFLWSGAPLPAEVTLAEYAHRGAYPLIITALLAGLFVLMTLQPGSATASAPAIRRLVMLWIVQNLFLVASAILRTIDYIEAYSLTRFRIAALIWMGLVALGLVLTVWRMLRGRSAAWLINANVAAALTVLTLCSALDLGSTAAAWNVRHAREVGGSGDALDLCYLNRLGPSALVSLVRLELRGDLAPEFASRVRWIRHRVLAETTAGQSAGWWTWRNARRLREVEAMLGGTRLPAPPDRDSIGRDCDGAPLPQQPQPEGAEPAPPTPPSAISTNPERPALTNEAAG